MLSGGGTDDQCVKLAQGLRVARAAGSGWPGPDGREFARVARELGVPFHARRRKGR